MNRNISLPSRHARGFTLIEALVALLVLSIGLLGIGMMQLTSLSSGHSSGLRSQATFLAHDIVDRMRANRRAAEDGDYDIAIGADAASGTIPGDDLIAWKSAVFNTLPAGDSAVARTTAVAGGITVTTFTITIQWNDSKDPAIDPVQFVMETQL
jgi:type IV pilus assembly protein PilV